MGALVTGSAAAVGSGAFTSVEADRDITVEVADDSDAFLRLDANPPFPNSEYAEEEDGQLVIDIGDTEAGGQGVNPNAITNLDDVFRMFNQGTQEVEFFFELSEEIEEFIDIYQIAGGDSSTVGEGGDTSLVGEGNAGSGPGFGGTGEQLRIGISVDLRGEDAPAPSELGGEVTVFADSVE